MLEYGRNLYVAIFSAKKTRNGTLAITYYKKGKFFVIKNDKIQISMRNKISPPPPMVCWKIFSNKNKDYLRNWIRNKWLMDLENKRPGSLNTVWRDLWSLYTSSQNS